jgi:type IV pilus assembly protein PilC
MNYKRGGTSRKKIKEKKSLFGSDIAIGGINLTQKAVFAKHLAVMLKSGLNVVEALKISTSSVKGKFRKIVIQVLKSVQAGHRLSSALARYPKVFSGLFVGATYAGESSGTLDKSLENIADQLKKEQELMSKVKGAMLYPVVILIAAFILGMAMTFFILPKITPMFEGMGTDLPATTRGLMWFSALVQEHGVALFIGTVVGITFLVWLAKQKFSKPVVHLLILKAPIIKNISRNSNLARFCLTLGILLKSGLHIDEALKISSKTLNNFYYKKALIKVNERVNKGTALSKNLDRYKKLFPPMMTKMVMVGERSGKLEETLLYLSEFYQIEVDNDTKSLSTIIEPLLLMSIGLVVGFLALSIITPIYNITGTVSK